MRDIALIGLEIEGFRSYRQRQVITFDDKAGLYYLTGRNQVEKRLGSNGSGKSSLWEALAWCLYGSTTSDDKASDVVSWGAEFPLVTVKLSLNGEPCEITRKGMPNKLWMNNQVIEQKGVDRLLGLDRARFQQAVLFGQFAPLFMELSVGERGEILDEVLSLDSWLTLADEAAAKERELDEAFKADDRVLARLQGQIDELADEASLQADIESWEQHHLAELDEAIGEVEAAELKEAKLQREFAALSKPAPQPKVQRQSTENLRVQIKVALAQKRELDDRATFYHKHDDCPTCGQKLHETFIKEQMNYLLNEGSRLDADVAVWQSELRMAQQVNERESVEASEAERNYIRVDYALREAESRVEELVRNAERIGNATENPFKARLEQVRERRAKLEAESRSVLRRKGSLKVELEKARYWRNGFKLVRLFIIKRILRSLELEVMAAAASLGLLQWDIHFTTETLTKSQTVRHGVQVQVKPPTTDKALTKWSGGEGQRVKLAGNIGLSNLIQRRAGVRFGFEVWDEPTEHLSPEGIEDLLIALDARAERTGKQIWVADQTAPVFTGFRATWTAIKDENGTHIDQG